MSVPYTQFTVYTFGSSASFNRLVDNNYPVWFGQKIEYTQDSVKASGRDYVDIGATVFENLAFIAVFGSAAERTDMIARIGSQATLANDKGYSDVAILINAGPIDIAAPGLYGLSVTFVKRPAS